MSGRDLTLIECIRSRSPDWPELARRGLAFIRTVLMLCRWAWLRVTGKTAYRFAPMYETKILDPNPPLGRVSAIRQANGLYLPAPDPLPHDPTIRDDLRAAWDALEAKADKT